MVGIDVRILEAWCQEAISLLPLPEVPRELAELRRDNVVRFSGSAKLFDIAADLAEGIQDLPESERITANSKLIGKFGFGYEFFSDKKMASIRKIIKRGRIKSEEEHRQCLDALADNEISDALAKTVNSLIEKHEQKA